ncbi:hypothetical protein HOY82DRAFT_536691 [Tuber indicum]|nr:hypothetical protein HOY82DRAFT_536691 [Tuber indicum]
MPNQTNTTPESPRPAGSHTFLRVLSTHPDELRALVEMWTVALADPETSAPELRRISANVHLVGWGLTELRETVRARMRVLEAEGYGRGGAALAREMRERQRGGRN